jgi:elongation factor P
MALRIDRQIYRVLEVEAKAGAAKMGGVVKAKLLNARTARGWEPHFRPQERLEDLQLERRTMQFLYGDDDNCTFMRPDTFEQIEVPSRILGAARSFLQSGMEMPVEFFENEPIRVVLPDVAEARVVRTASPSHSQQDSAGRRPPWKTASRFASRSSSHPARRFAST